MENKIPEYLRKLSEEAAEASKKFHTASAEWEQAKTEMKDSECFALTGEKRPPKKGEMFLSAFGVSPIKADCDFAPDMPRFILSKIEPEAGREPEPRVVWACPPEVMTWMEYLPVYAASICKDKILAAHAERVLSLCRSTREATVEEIRKSYFSSGGPGIGLQNQFAERLIQSLNRDGLRIVREGE